MTKTKTTNKVSLYNRWLTGIEAVGNKLPHPIALFAALAGIIVVISAICSALGVSATGELISDGKLQETTVTTVSLLTKEGLTYMLTNAVNNFTTSVSAEELKTALSSVAEVTDLTKNCITDIVRTKAGGVKTLKVGGKEISGSAIRKALELRSANFEVTFKDGNYTFSVKGYGHAVGMSQNGANYLAQQGKSYEEILLHYYTGCSVK